MYKLKTKREYVGIIINKKICPAVRVDSSYRTPGLYEMPDLKKKNA